MMEMALNSVLTICIVITCWVSVQRLWLIVFERGSDADALQGRLGCRGCQCRSRCKDESGELLEDNIQ